MARRLYYYDLVPTATRRPLRHDEIETAAALFAESAADLAQRHGVRSSIPGVQAPLEAIALAYEHIAKNGIFRVAEDGGRIVALACAIVRGPWWFLSGFWVRPGMQSQGIGGPLLDEVVREGERAGARAFFTWSSVDPRAVGAYLRRGFLPGWPMLVFVVEPSPSPSTSTLRTPYAPARGYELAELDPELPSHFAAAAGHPPRDTDHAFWRGTGHARAVVAGGEPVGYFYARRGSIGPLAWADDAHAPAVLDAALAAAGEAGEAAAVRVNVPGVAHAAIRHLTARGASLATFGHFLATESPGLMTRYVPSGPFLF